MDESARPIGARLLGAVRTLTIGLAAGLVPVGFGVVVDALVDGSAPVVNSGQVMLVVLAAEQHDHTAEDAETPVREFTPARQTFWDEFLGIPRQQEYVVQIGGVQDWVQAAELQSTLADAHEESSFTFPIFRYDDDRYVVTLGDQMTLPDAVRQLQAAVDAAIPGAELRRVPE